MTRVLVTNDGPHPAEQMAMVTAEQLTESNPDMSYERMFEVQKLRLALAEVLTPFHATNQMKTRATLQSHMAFNGDEDGDLIGHTMDAISKVTDNSPWREHYRQADVQDIARSIIARHFKHARDIERSWHKDREGQN